MKGYAARKGDRWYAVIYEGLDPGTGREIRRWHAAGTDKTSAEKPAHRLAREINGPNDDGRGLSFGAYLTQTWLPAKRIELRPSTWNGYRIADATVADQYFEATRAVEAEAVTAARAGGETRDATPVHRRLLGNGHCTRPLELDCRFQTICEGCGFFETGTEFVTILRRQRDDATAHDDLARTKLYEELVKVIDEGEAPSTP